MTTYYKALRAGRRGTHTEFVWPEPGEWVEVDGDLEACRNGLHVCRVDQLLDWLSDELWRVEVDEAAGLVDAGDKVVARRVRLVEQVPDADRRLQEFAADCAEHVLHLFEAVYPDDDRPRRAIAAARAYARGEITSAARAAARAAAGDAAQDAARDAAGAAAWDAARDAAWGAAWGAERDWQAARLTHWLQVELDA